ncbi:MAG TPA: protease complex subunit PrcB family protein [Gemmatimonadales bacterium]|nr:protease complex subunit PrcB family protein [Gemmatimonadales bacterium]
MIARLVYLIPVAVLMACGGTTMRVAEGDSTDYGPVALAPEPEYGPDSAAPAPAPAPAEEPQAEWTDTTTQQGYAPYGSSATVQIRRIGQWTHTGINERRRLVIRDANAWAAFWSELGVGDRPEVDFNRDLVVAVAAGQQSSGGHEVAVDKVAQNNGELIIEVVETAPGPNCVTTAALTQPVDVVVVPNVNARGWSFVERKEVRGCR